MTKEKIKEKIQTAINTMKSQLELMEGVLENCNYIVDTPMYIIGCDETGNVVKTDTNSPTQFTEKTAYEIASNIPDAKVWLAKEWYQNEINELETILTVLN